METISQFTYCEKIQIANAPDGKITKSYISPMTKITPKFFPTHYSFSMSFTISNITPNPDNNLEISFNDPAGEKVESLNISHCTPPPEIVKPEKKEYSTTVDVDYTNVILKNPGTYKTIISFNNKKLGSFDLEVEKISSDQVD